MRSPFRQRYPHQPFEVWVYPMTSVNDRPWSRHWVIWGRGVPVANGDTSEFEAEKVITAAVNRALRDFFDDGQDDWRRQSAAHYARYHA